MNKSIKREILNRLTLILFINTMKLLKGPKVLQRKLILEQNKFQNIEQ